MPAKRRYLDRAVAPRATRCAPARWSPISGAAPGCTFRICPGPTVALDAAAAMVELARDAAPDVPGVQGDLEALPFRRGALGGAWARASYLHVPA